MANVAGELLLMSAVCARFIEPRLWVAVLTVRSFFHFIPVRVHDTRSMQLSSVMAVSASHPGLYPVHVAGAVIGQVQTALFGHTMTANANLVHGWGFAELMTCNQPAFGWIGATDVALPTSGVAGGTIDFIYFGQLLIHDAHVRASFHGGDLPQERVV